MIWWILVWAWIITPFVLATIAAARFNRFHYWYSRRGAFFGRFFSSLAIGTIVMFFASLTLGFVSAVTGYHTTESWDTKLRALNTGSEISGRFYFLGSGRMDESPVFTFLYEQADGGVKLTSVPAAMATVYEDETASPYLTTHEATLQPNEFWAPFAIVSGVTHTFDFHIPEGSVLNGYEVAP